MPLINQFPQARPVFPGANLRVIAPSGPFNPESFELGIEWLRNRYTVSFSDSIYEKSGYFAGSDERRLLELNEAIQDQSVDAIVCARGGFGCTRLLPGVDISSITQANKLILGFSDITALHSLWAIARVRSIHAPMVAALGRASERIRGDWVAMVENLCQSTLWVLDRVDQRGDVSEKVVGRFFGGNLAVMAALVGTPYAPPLRGSILFLEDVGERPYRIDRMLTTLRQAGWFDELNGLVLGSFTEGEPGNDGVTNDQVFDNHFRFAQFPVLKGIQVGHIDENQPVILGCQASISGINLELFN